MAKKLEDWQEEDARRLKALFEDRAGQSQLAFGAAHEIGNQSMVSQYLLGIRPLNIVAATKFATGLNVTIDEISPTLAAQIEAAWRLTTAGKQQTQGSPEVAVRRVLGKDAIQQESKKSENTMTAVNEQARGANKKGDGSRSK